MLLSIILQNQGNDLNHILNVINHKCKNKKEVEIVVGLDYKSLHNYRGKVRLIYVPCNKLETMIKHCNGTYLWFLQDDVYSMTTSFDVHLQKYLTPYIMMYDLNNDKGYMCSPILNKKFFDLIHFDTIDMTYILMLMTYTKRIQFISEVVVCYGTAKPMFDYILKKDMKILDDELKKEHLTLEF